MNFTNYKDASPYLTKIKDIRTNREGIALLNRNLRQLNLDVLRNRMNGRVAVDELLIPSHVIDTNLRREQARYVSYVMTSARAAILIDIKDNSRHTEALEKDFTQRVRYEGWERDVFKVIDGMQLHRAGAFHIELAPSNPGSLRFSPIAFEDLLYLDDTVNIQTAEILGVCLSRTRTQLESMKGKDRVNDKVIDKILSDKETNVNVSAYHIYRIYTRKDGVVYEALWSKDGDDWLQTPAPLHLGRWTIRVDPATQKSIPGKQLPETLYPIIFCPYQISEDPRIFYIQGRADIDRYTQDAVCSLLSSYVTGVRRASSFYFSRGEGSAAFSGTLAQTDIQLTPNTFIDGNIKQFQLAAPTMQVVSTVQQLLGLNQQETSQINFAALNRKDTEKTATEISAAQNEASALSATQLALFSTTLKQLFTYAFSIIANRVQCGLIEVSPELIELYSRSYNIRPAGDVDVVERQQKIQNMLKAWEVIGQTPAAPEFLKDIISAMFPERAAMYIKYISEDQTRQQQLAQAAEIIKALAINPDTGQLDPDAQAFGPQLQQFLGSILPQNAQPAR